MSGQAIANNDTVTVSANLGLWVDATRNDIQNNGATLSLVSLNLTGTKGTAKLNPIGPNGFQYNTGPAFNYLSLGETATDTLQYTATDSLGDRVTATVTIIVTGVNFAPVAGRVAVATNATGGISINALASDTDPNLDDTLTITSLNLSGIKGTAAIDPTTGAIDYSPNGAFAYLSAGQTATETFSYTVSDNHGASSTNTVTVTVGGVNVPPVAVSDTWTTAANQYINVSPTANDTDVNRGDSLKVVAVNTAGTKGSAVLQSAYNEITYNPNHAFDYLSAGETAIDTFQYTISDGHGGTATATDTVVIAGINRAPVAGKITSTTSAHTDIVINALASDTDPNRDDTLTITALNLSGIKGTAKIDPVTGAIDYSPNGAFNYLSVGQTSTDTFSYTVSDNHGATSTNTVTISVAGVNVAPVATAETATVSAYSGVFVNATRYDTDVNQSDQLSIVALNLSGTKGYVSLNPATNNGFEYSPNNAFNYLSAGESATDSFLYTVSDNHGASSVGTVTVTVTGVNTPPVAGPESATTYANQPVTINILSNVTDINRDDQLTVSSLNLTGTLGTVSIGSNGNVVYIPGGADAALTFGESATDSFGYTVSDGHGGAASATVTVAISGPPPSVSDLLGAGYLSTRGSQVINAAGKVARIVSIGWSGDDGQQFALHNLNAIGYQKIMQEMVQAGFNTVRIPWSDALLAATPAPGSINYMLNPDLQGLNSIQALQTIVAYAGQIGLKIIFDHHNNEGYAGQQVNGLWYDVGGASNGTDGEGHTGTVSQQAFQNNWVTFAKLWAGNSTVIGFDLANEPISGTWTGPATTSIETMATTVGDAIQSVDPGALIIVEGAGSNVAPEGDLSGVASNPVVLTDPNKVVYSVHEYPPSVNSAIFSGNPAQYIAQMNAAWGYLVTSNTAPVWIGEMGSSLITATDQLWAQTLVNYMNGDYAAEGGPSVTSTTQGVSGDWWGWYNSPTSITSAPDGLLQPNLTDMRQDQFAIVQQMYPTQTTTTTTTTTVNNSIILDMAEDYASGNAQFSVAVDGVAVGGTQTVTAIRSAGQVQQFFLSGNFAAGSHQVTISFLNDYYNTTTLADRNLFVKGIEFDGTAQSGSTASMYGNGPKTFNVQASGTVTATTTPDTLILQMSDNSAAGGSTFDVFVDGTQIGNTETLTATTTAGTVQTFAFEGQLGGGSHQIDIRQLNAPVGGSTISVQTIDYDGALQSATPTNPTGAPDQDFAIAGSSTINGGTINLGSDTASVVITNPNHMAFMAAGVHAIETDASGFTLAVAGGSATLTNFNPTVDTIELMGGIGGFTSASQAAAAISYDGSGGSKLVLASGSLDFIGTSTGSFSPQTFVLH